MRRGIRRRWGGNIIGTVFIIIAIPVFLMGLIALISPSLFFAIIGNLPRDIQNVIFADMWVGWMPRSLAYMLAGVILWVIGGWLRS